MDIVDLLERLANLHGPRIINIFLEYLRGKITGHLQQPGTAYGESPEGSTSANIVPSRQENANATHKKDDGEAGSQARKRNLKVFVKNINFKTRQRVLWDLFDQFGNVKHCRILKGSGHQKSRGMAVISFEDVEGVQYALSAIPEQLELDGQILVVMPAEKKERTYTKEVNTRSEYLVQPFFTGATPIHMLNDDTLSAIFAYLSLRELVVIERVCSRWREVGLRLWQSLQKFDVASCMVNITGIKDKDIKSILQKTNPESLHTVNLSAAGRFLTEMSLNTIGRLCPNLKKLNISKTEGTNRGLKFLAEKCSALETVAADNCFNFGEDGLWWLFHLCKELRHLSLINNKRLKGQCFHVMCRNLTTLTLAGCCKLQDVALVKVAARCPDLTDLTLDECFKLSDESLKHVTQNCKRIQKLSMKQLPNVTMMGLSLIGQLTELRDLHLASLSLQVTDHVVTTIANGCRLLRVLDLTCCYEVTDQGVSALTNCEQLTELKVSYLHLLTDTGLIPIVQLGRLTTLICRACGGLTEHVFAEIAAHCCLMQLLDISGCDQLGWNTLRKFEDAELTRQTQLSIIAGGTGFGLEFDLSLPTIYVSDVDLSDKRLRRDLDLFFELRGDVDSDEDWGNDDFPDYDEQDWAEFNDDFLANDDPLMYERWNMS